MDKIYIFLLLVLSLTFIEIKTKAVSNIFVAVFINILIICLTPTIGSKWLFFKAAKTRIESGDNDEYCLLPTFSLRVELSYELEPYMAYMTIKLSFYFLNHYCCLLVSIYD